MHEVQRVIRRYSLNFKQKVISEIESGKLTKSEARRLYGIGSETSIQKWIKQLGKLHLLNKVVRIELKDEVSRLKQLEKEKKELESALARAHLKLITYESIIEVAEEELGIEIKKNLKSGSLSEVIKEVKGSKQRRK
jgi:transposase-like protein